MAELLGGIAVSPDLYRGKVAVTGDEAGHLMKGLNWEQAMKDLNIAAKFLKSKGVKKVGITGFCMGGALTLAAGVHCATELTSGVCFYGIPPHDFADPKKLSIPMAFHFGNQDPAKGFSDKAVRRWIVS
jgi:carboxymethylenebutenolidase